MFAYAPNPTGWIDPLGLDVLVIHNGQTLTRGGGNPFGHTAIAIEGYGLYSFGNAGIEPDDILPSASDVSINNNIMGGNAQVLDEYIRREAGNRDSRFTLIETTPEQDKRIVEILDQFTSTAGKFDNCASRIIRGLSTLRPDLDIVTRLTVHTDGTFPREAEQDAKVYMYAFGGQRYKLDQVSEEEASEIILKPVFSRFNNQEQTND